MLDFQEFFLDFLGRSLFLEAPVFIVVIGFGVQTNLFNLNSNSFDFCIFVFAIWYFVLQLF